MRMRIGLRPVKADPFIVGVDSQIQMSDVQIPDDRFLRNLIEIGWIAITQKLANIGMADEKPKLVFLSVKGGETDAWFGFEQFADISPRDLALKPKEFYDSILGPMWKKVKDDIENAATQGSEVLNV